MLVARVATSFLQALCERRLPLTLPGPLFEFCRSDSWTRRVNLKLGHGVQRCLRRLDVIIILWIFLGP